MNKILKNIVIAFTSVFLLASCTNGSAKDGVVPMLPDTSNKLKVYTSFYPMYDFANKIGGDKIELVNLLPAGEEVHHWEPTPSDIVNIENANVFIYSGVGMEHWVETVIPTIQNKSLIIVEASSGIELLSHEEHEDETDIHKDNELPHIEDDHDQEGSDPHVWLSIKNAKKEMENIKNAFVLADEKNKDFYESNYLKFSKEFDDLDNEFKAELLNLNKNTIIVSHESFGYLANDYGLIQIGIEGLVPNSEPDPARMSDVIEIVKENGATVIFFEELMGTKVAETIAKETGAKIDMLNTLESVSQKDLDSGKEYVSLMRENLEAIKNSLK